MIIHPPAPTPAFQSHAGSIEARNALILGIFDRVSIPRWFD